MWEQSILPNVSNTVDGSTAFVPTAMNAQPAVPDQASTAPKFAGPVAALPGAGTSTPPAAPAQPMGRPNTPPPTTTAPTTAGGVAQGAMGSAMNWLGGLFK